MNFIENESKQKLRGGFYTEPDIAAYLSRWVLEKRPRSILEPSCGDGAFIGALADEKPNSVTRIFACEMDGKEALKARRRFPGGKRRRVEILAEDFLQWFLSNGDSVARFDAALGNPPFIRYQYLPQEQQLLSERIFAKFGLPFTKHTNAWVPFVIASLSLLNPGGRLAMVVPSEIFHIPHAQSLRGFLIAQCSKILILDPEELWFDDALQGVVLLLAEKKTDESEASSGVAVHSVFDRKLLNDRATKLFGTSDYIQDESIDRKWMQVFLSRRERGLLKELRKSPGFTTFAEAATVDVGIVTGANKFFLVPDEIVETYHLHRWAHPMFGRSEHVSGIIYDRASHASNRRAGRPTSFLWFDDAALSSFPDKVQQYLRSGEQQGLPKRYKCRIRQPWFRVPSVHTAPVAMLKRAHNFPRLVLNSANAYTTDTAYRIEPKKIDATSLVCGFMNSVTCLCAELEGRHYGGGVLELVPSEIERLLLPIYPATESDLDQLDRRFRGRSDDADILKEQDERILAAVGLSLADRGGFYDAWIRLRNRRQRNSVNPGALKIPKNGEEPELMAGR